MFRLIINWVTVSERLFDLNRLSMYCSDWSRPGSRSPCQARTFHAVGSRSVNSRKYSGTSSSEPASVRSGRWPLRILPCRSLVTRSRSSRAVRSSIRQTAMTFSRSDCLIRLLPVSILLIFGWLQVSSLANTTWVRFASTRACRIRLPACLRAEVTVLSDADVAMTATVEHRAGV